MNQATPVTRIGSSVAVKVNALAPWSIDHSVYAVRHEPGNENAVPRAIGMPPAPTGVCCRTALAMDLGTVLVYVSGRVCEFSSATSRHVVKCEYF